MTHGLLLGALDAEQLVEAGPARRRRLLRCLGLGCAEESTKATTHQQRARENALERMEQHDLGKCSPSLASVSAARTTGNGRLPANGADKRQGMGQTLLCSRLLCRRGAKERGVYQCG